MSEANEISVIIEFSMNEDEAKAYKVCLIYLEKYKKFFPHEFRYNLPKGDPRKSYLFRHCYTLLREHGKELPDEDIKLYIHAQFDILKHITKNNQHPRIGPEVISGQKAWNRWLLWKSKYDKIKKFAVVNQTIDLNKQKEVIELLGKTKQYLNVMFGKYTKENIIKSMDDGEFWLWVLWGKICYYYLMLSPSVKSWLEKSNVDLSSKIKFDKSLYESGIQDKKVLEYFQKEFQEEFQKLNVA